MNYYYGGIQGTVDQPAPSRLFFLPWPFKERSSSSSSPSSSSNYSSPAIHLITSRCPSDAHGFFSSSRPTNQRRPLRQPPPARNPDSNFIPFLPSALTTQSTHTENNHADEGDLFPSRCSGRRPGVGSGWLSASAGLKQETQPGCS